MNVTEVTKTAEFNLPRWSTGEFLDMPFSDGVILRALVCPTGAGKWQWTVLSLQGEGGEVIGIGVAETLAQARRIAADELDKCVHDPFA